MIDRRRTVASLLAMCIVLGPACARSDEVPPAATSEQDAASKEWVQATTDGERDAASEEGGATWFAAGCLLLTSGVVIAYVVDPSPPIPRLMGKSLTYIQAYTAGYKSAGKKAQGRMAMIGCAVGALAIAVIEVAALFAVPPPAP